MKEKELGFSSSFIDEMKSDSVRIKKSNRKAIWGEVFSYILYLTELIRNVIFYALVLEFIASKYTSIFYFTSGISLLAFFGIVINYISVERILNGGKLSKHNILVICGYIFLGLYSNIFLNIYYIMRL